MVLDDERRLMQGWRGGRGGWTSDYEHIYFCSIFLLRKFWMKMRSLFTKWSIQEVGGGGFVPPETEEAVKPCAVVLLHGRILLKISRTLTLAQ